MVNMVDCNLVLYYYLILIYIFLLILFFLLRNILLLIVLLFHPNHIFQYSLLLIFLFLHLFLLMIVIHVWEFHYMEHHWYYYLLYLDFDFVDKYFHFDIYFHLVNLLLDLNFDFYILTSRWFWLINIIIFSWKNIICRFCLTGRLK